MNLEKIGSFIKDIRKEKGLTQEQLAEKLGVSQKSVSRWETGKTMPDYSLLPVICEVLEINVAELLGAERISGDSVPKKQVTAMAQNMILLVNNKSHVRKIVGAILSAVIMLVGVVGLYNYEYSVSVDSTADLEKAINEYHFADLFKFDEYEYTLNSVDEMVQFTKEHGGFPFQFTHFVDDPKEKNKLKNFIFGTPQIKANVEIHLYDCNFAHLLYAVLLTALAFKLEVMSNGRIYGAS